MHLTPHLQRQIFWRTLKQVCITTQYLETDLILLLWHAYINVVVAILPPLCWTIFVTNLIVARTGVSESAAQLEEGDAALKMRLQSKISSCRDAVRRLHARKPEVL